MKTMMQSRVTDLMARGFRVASNTNSWQWSHTPLWHEVEAFRALHPTTILNTLIDLENESGMGGVTWLIGFASRQMQLRHSEIEQNVLNRWLCAGLAYAQAFNGIGQVQHASH